MIFLYLSEELRSLTIILSLSSVYWCGVESLVAIVDGSGARS